MIGSTARPEWREGDVGGTNFGKAVSLLSGGRFLSWLSWPRPKRAGRLHTGEAMPGHPQAGMPHRDTPRGLFTARRQHKAPLPGAGAYN